MRAVYQASAASIAQCLNITIEVSNKDGKIYMDALNAKPTQLTLELYPMEWIFLIQLTCLEFGYLAEDTLENDEFDRLVAEASNLVGMIKRGNKCSVTPKDSRR